MKKNKKDKKSQEKEFKNLLTNMKKVWPFARDQKKFIFLYVLVNFFNMLISIVLPIVSAKIIISLTNNTLKQLVFLAAIIFILENIRNVIHVLEDFASQRIYRDTFNKLQTRLGTEIFSLHNKSIDENSSGVFIERLTGDTSRIANIFIFLTNYLSSIITNIGIFVAIFIVNKIIFAFVVTSITIVYFMDTKRVKEVAEKDRKYRKTAETASGFVGELVRGVRDIKMLNAEQGFIKEFENKVNDVNESRYSMRATNRRYNFIIGTFNDFIDFAQIALMAVLIYIGNLSIPNALIVHNYASRVESIIYFVGAMLDQIKDFNLSCERIFALMGNKKFKKEKFGTKHLDHVNGNFEFKNVSFAYNEKEVLKDVSFKIKANETVGFVGKSGSGKSTIFNLLCKMYDVNSGQITIDGENINNLDRESIRGNITIISQNPYIFNLSIRDNLRLVKEDLTEEDMIKACKLACLDDFIESLPDKYDTIVGEGGVTLSGGQKQRLAIARAFVQKTKIILFDEATSALDNETQASIQKAIDNMKEDYTILIIAHRLSTIVNSDRILFLEDGRITAEGSHNKLLKSSKKYRELYESEIEK